MKPAQGWISFLTGLVGIIAGLLLLTPYFNQQAIGLAFLIGGGGILGIAGNLANLTNTLRTNNEVSAQAAAALTQKPPDQVLAEAQVAAGQPVEAAKTAARVPEPDPNAARMGGGGRE